MALRSDDKADEAIRRKEERALARREGNAAEDALLVIR